MMQKKSIGREAQNVRQKKEKTSYMIKKLMTNDEKMLLGKEGKTLGQKKII